MPLKASEEVTQKVAREVPEPFIKEVSAFKDCKEGGYAKVEYEDNVPQVFPKVEEGDKAQPEAEDVDEEPPSTLVINEAYAPETPPLGVSYTLTVTHFGI